jgi:hypothetical protein
MLNVLKELKARIVIPMHYFGPTTLARFIDKARSDFEIETATSPILVLSARDLPAKPKVVILPGH